MIVKNAKELMQRLDFPTEAQNELVISLEKLVSTNEFLSVVNRFEIDDYDFLKALDDTKILAENIKISYYTAHMLLFICMAPILHKKYTEKGIDSNIFYDTMRDLRYKLEECRLVHNKCGTFVGKWYKGFFEMKIFALGRLQFELNNLWFDCEVNGKKIPKGSKVLSVHIPRTNTKLDHDLVVDSYRRAKEFFKEHFDNDTIFICNSWLLYPWNRSVYKDGSNLAQFYDDFTVVQSGEYKDYSECWRLFDCLYDGQPDKLPCDTSLRRAFINRMISGKPLGYGTGIIILN